MIIKILKEMMFRIILGVICGVLVTYLTEDRNLGLVVSCLISALYHV